MTIMVRHTPNRHIASKAGFTLVEMLVTLTIFSLVLGVLVSGLRAGARAYRSVDDHQRQSAELERVQRQLREDLRHLAIVSEEVPAVAESQDGSGGESVVLSVLMPRHRQQMGQIGVWQTVEYAILPETRELVRRATANVVGSVAAEPVEQTLLAAGKGLQFDYLSAEGEQPEWSEQSAVPPAVQVTLDLASGQTVRWVFGVPLGMAQQGLNAQ